MSQNNNNWKKIKYSSSFYRKCAKTRDNILRFASDAKLSKNIHQNSDFHHQNNLLEYSFNTVKDDEAGNILECIDTRENWLSELEDDQSNSEILNEDVYCEQSIERKNLVLADFRQWSVSSNISQSSLRGLFSIVNKHWPNTLPKDPRTLLETPNKTNIVEIADGQFYWHQGLEFCLKTYCNIKNDNEQTIWININMDGIPIYKSSKDEFWPILFNIHNYPEIKPMAIGIFQGKSKPLSIELFLNPFVKEFKKISRDGIRLENGSKLYVKIRCFIADSPARAFIKGVANFNSQQGCLKCVTNGEYSYLSHCNIFPRSQCAKRTDEGFRAMIYGSHHKCRTPLLEIPGLDMIKDFPIGDVLHLLDLGIMKRCLVGWRDGSFNNYKTKWSARDIQEISTFLTNCKLPTEIHRSVRGLDCLAFWKGLEFRSFLLYIGPVILRKYLPYDAYEHFLMLFCATTICSSDIYKTGLDLAEALLDHYVEQFAEIYGVEHITSNIHNLTHLIDDVRRFGSLMTFSAYPFESQLYQIKRLLRSGRNPLTQAARRLHEVSLVENTSTVKEQTKSKVSLKRPNNGETIDQNLLLKSSLSQCTFFYKVEFEDYCISNENRNCWFLTFSNKIVSAENILSSTSGIQIYGFCLKNCFLFFETPIKSSYLNIYCSDGTKNDSPKLYLKSKIKCKLVKIDFEDMLVFIPLLHTICKK